jgi:hypothetical protein
MFVPRTVHAYVKQDANTSSRDTSSSLPLTSLRNHRAYVLLGDPGMGKTSAFDVEAEAAGVKPIKAHDFIELNQENSAWAGKTIFIDGFDETRAGAKDGRTPLGAIRGKLDTLGRPRFRLSCRAADWFGSSDEAALQALMPDGERIGVFNLDPLTDSDVEMILSENHGVINPRAFMHEAERHRLNELLNNPQTLQLLAKAVGTDGRWPTTRQETYEMACRKLGTEINSEHQAAQQNSGPNIDDLFAAAGYLCALNLISDLSAFSPMTIEGQPALGLNVIDDRERLPLHAVLHTGLFRSLGDGSYTPAHRSIAEFLAAKFIAGKIEKSLPVGRVLALISGADGGVVTELRALAAWLAVFSPEFRSRQIEDDPLGIFLYGDAKNFSTMEKTSTLSAIKNKGDSSLVFNWGDWHLQTFEALATPDMAQAFERLIRTVPATRGDQLVANCIVEALYRGEVVPNMAETLLAVVREPRWWGGVRNIALRAYLKSYSAEQAQSKALLEDVRIGAVKDDDDELLGILLDHLYPSQVTPEELVKFLHPNKNKTYSGSYRWFWRDDFLERTPKAQLDQLINAFRTITPFHNREESRELWVIASSLLARGIEELGDTIIDETLYEWLGIVMDERQHNHLEQTARARIDGWFSIRPQRYKGVLAESLDRTPDNDFFRFNITARLRGIPAPNDMGNWWLRQAETATTEMRARIFFNNAFAILDDGSMYGGVSLEAIEEWVSTRPQFAGQLTRKLFDPLFDDQGEAVWQVDEARRKLAGLAERKAYADRVRAVLEKLRNNTEHPQTIYYFALAYQDLLSDTRGDTPDARLANLLNNDPELLEVALSALEGTLERTDLPTVEQILESDSKGKMFHLTPALLVGMELAHKTDPTRIASLDDDLLMRALVSGYVYGAGEERAWFNLLVAEKPNLVADACTMYMQARFKSRKEHIHGIYPLAHDSKYAEIAKRVVPVLLPSFPHRARLTQLSVLEYLLKSALRYMDKTALDLQIQARLKLTSLDVAQRIYWLSAGVILNADKYLEPLTKYVAGKEIRVGHLGAFLYRMNGEDRHLGNLSIETTTRLVEIMAPSCNPQRHASGNGTVNMNHADLLRKWIDNLAANQSADATRELSRLAALPELKHWAEQLGQARLQQSTVARDYGFVHPNHAQVASTIYLGPPANAADIAAIVNEVLNEIAKNIGTSDLNLYRQFWNVDSHNRILDPKPEPACRDALAALMRERLKKYSIQIQAEAHHVDEKRSDILCTFNQGAIPVEIKLDTHRDMWRAINQQLIPKYSIDPRAQGFGIYLVLWFGGGRQMPAPESGRKPTTASQLLQRLKDQVPTEQTKRITVHVIDCCRTL